jgi:hypothetical protein
MSRRGGGAADDETYNGHLATPQYDASAIEHMKLSLDDDSPYPVSGTDDEEEEEEDENEEDEQVLMLFWNLKVCVLSPPLPYLLWDAQERFSRGRSRSRSLHSLDEDPATGVVKIDPLAIPQAGEHKPAEIVERSGPLPQKDMEILKKVS